ncbi:hypothetical protein OOK41_28575 [Micromonospora sp. NBC_01655]|uniref:hypothetical protein n=1 Tax=Micromonospora sp. NBC_01655 TaxID=2975983 RepID=UPI00225BB931|nr:hypothetical protein [Micromonospora sp. NBC_01655]MCX4474217.1 hypothetical protein [Micromonospora sp. NBC_01655]
MAVRRQATRLATVCVMLGGLVAVGATPALADGDSVRVRSTDSFRPGGSPGAVNVEVRKRTEGCVLVRTGLGLRLDGLAGDHAAVQVAMAGRWWPVSVSGGGGAVTASQVTPANPTLCKGKSLTVRYRVAFRAGTPGGRLELAGAATNAVGRALGRDATTARVVGEKKSPSPSPTPTRKPSPRPTVAPAEAVDADGPTLAAVAGRAGSATPVAAEENSGGLSVFMLFGVGLVVVGIGLIVLLVRRSRADKEPADPPGAYPPVPVPRNPGGTTYRSGGGAAAPPAPPAGGVYGRPAAPPSGGVYGARPGPPAAGPVSGGGVYGGGTTYPAAGVPPRQPGQPEAPGQGGAPGPGGAPAPRGPGEPPAPAGGGDATTIMPRLPG